MRRFWIQQSPLEVGLVLEVERDEFHHLCVVCRQSEGSRFEILNGSGKAYFSVLRSIGKKKAEIELLEERDVVQQRPPWLRLFVSLPKFATFDTILEKSVELGVKSVHPLLSDFSFVRSLEKVSGSKKERWSRIVNGATRQCGRGDLMEVAEIVRLSESLAEFNRSKGLLGLFPYEGEAAQSFSQALSKWQNHVHEEIWCYVGSEGGFSDREIELFRIYGFEPCTLGEQVLRVETACLALTSVIKYHTGQFQ